MIELTPEQRLAVSLDCPRLLVSASAGTGKTQVLTQRYLRLVLERQVEVGQIVAVTFTEAAAAEMRSRIGQALRSRLQSPGAGIQADWLRRQLLLLERAPICTLHSFCLRMVREFFFLLDLDPDFSVLDAAEAAVLKADVLEDTLERWFEQCPDGVDDEAFHRLVDEYGGLLAGEHLSHLLLELDAFLNTLPDAQAWWDDVVSLHEKPDPLSAKTERLRLIWKTIPAEQHQEAIEELRQLAPLVRVLRALHAEFAETYWKRKLQRACVDFDDLEKLAWKLLREHPRIRDELRHRYRHILVDEYQDINPLQNAILECLHGNDPHNQWFMVGDVKQSIYGFRLACPALFQEKVLRYLRVSPSPEASSPAQCDLPQLSDKDPPGIRVALTKNFRSRRTVLDTINAVFEQIAAGGAFGMQYDESEQLHYASEYYESAGESSHEEPVSLHLVLGAAEDQNESEGDEASANPWRVWERLENEATVAADLIRQWVGQRLIWDVEKRQFRPAEFRDIAILMRAVQGKAGTVVRALRQNGIPVHAELRSGFWEALEVRDMLAVLELLRNPLDDVPLAAVLRSPLVGLSAAELAEIRLGQRDGPFYVAVHRYAHQENGPVAERLRTFLGQLQMWRERACRQSIARLLWDIYRETGYLAFVQGLPDGAARYANLIALHDRARQFEAGSGGDVARFLHYLERLRQQEQDFGTASVSVPAENVVRLMSIHQSKGLEFPIVLILDLGSQFNEESLRGSLLFHRDLLLGARVQDERGVYRWPSRLYEQIQAQLRRDLLAEELRLLYVAMTRARECLALIGTQTRSTQASKSRTKTASNAAKRTATDTGNSNQSDGNVDSEKLPPPEKLRSHLEWVLPVFKRLSTQLSTLALREWNSLELAKVRQRSSASWAVKADGETVTDANPDLPSEATRMTETDAARLANETLRRVTWQYPYLAATRLPGKTSPTRWRLWLQLDPETVTWPQVVHRCRTVPAPSFVAATKPTLSAVERGQLTHRFLRHLQLTGRPVHQVEELQRQLRLMQEQGIFSEPELAGVDLEAVAAFFARPLGQRLVKASRFRREIPFSLVVPAIAMPELGKLISVSAKEFETLSEEKILVQGIMDALFWERDTGGPVLLDYKTDVLAPDQVIQAAESYRPQLSLYARAVHDALGEPCREIWAVFLTARQDIRLL